MTLEKAVINALNYGTTETEVVHTLNVFLGSWCVHWTKSLIIRRLENKSRGGHTKKKKLAM